MNIEELKDLPDGKYVTDEAVIRKGMNDITFYSRKDNSIIIIPNREELVPVEPASFDDEEIKSCLNEDRVAFMAYYDNQFADGAGFQEVGVYSTKQKAIDATSDVDGYRFVQEWTFDDGDEFPRIIRFQRIEDEQTLVDVK